MIQSKTAHKHSGAQSPSARIKSASNKKNRMVVQNTFWERDLTQLQKKLRQYAGHRSMTEELIRERKNET